MDTWEVNMNGKRKDRPATGWVILSVVALLALCSCGAPTPTTGMTPTLGGAPAAPSGGLSTRAATRVPTTASPTIERARSTATSTESPAVKPTEPPAPTLCAQARISGEVCDAGVKVTISSCCPEWSASTISDAQGHFEFAQLTAGIFQVSVQGDSREVILANCDSEVTLDLCPAPGIELSPPMVVDSEAGRLYMPATIDGAQRIVALAADDGQLLETYGISGTFAVDGARGWLYVDRGGAGLTVLDVGTGAQVVSVPLPGESYGVFPQADLASGQVLVFRENLVYIVDPVAGSVVDTIAFDIPKDEGDCRLLSGPLPIFQSAYDDGHRLLYLGFLTYVCTPWYMQTIVSYDLDEGVEVAREDYPMFPYITAADGYLYGSANWRLGSGSYWAWRDGQPWFEAGDCWGAGSMANFHYDANRGRVYGSTGDLIRVFDAATMVLLFHTTPPAEGHMVGYDARTDQLYFLSDGKLQVVPASAIQPLSPEPVEQHDPPGTAVWRLEVSPHWSQDQTLFGLWGDDRSCFVLGGSGGSLYRSVDGGRTWGKPVGGLRGICDGVSSLAISPGYAQDQTLLAGLAGSGLFKSTDGGRLWLPASAGLPSMYAKDIQFSPAFERDQTAFVLVSPFSSSFLYRSTDGGASWQSLGIELATFEVSPEFDRDGVLMGASCGADSSRVFLSRDRGDTWEQVGQIPFAVSSIDCVTMLAVAPSFDEYQVAFAFGHRTLYRSVDGGTSWDAVLGDVASPQPVPPLVFGPETEQGRRLFLVGANVIYLSEDGGQTWRTIELDMAAWVTALACSPDFVQDGLLFVGTASGQVLPIDVMALIGGQP